MIVIEKQLYYTVKDIAEAISFGTSQDAIARTARQVKYWTQCDLIKPANLKQSGRGYPRLYEDEGTYEIAAILQELTLYGITLDKLKPVSDYIYKYFEEFLMGPLFAALTHEGEGFLHIDWNIDQETGEFGQPEMFLYDTVDPDDDEAFLPKSSSSITLNLNKIVDRIRYPEWETKNRLYGNAS